MKILFLGDVMGRSGRRAITERLAGLRARGHRVTLAEPWTIGRLTAAARKPDGLLIAAATARLMQAYAVGR